MAIPGQAVNKFSCATSRFLLPTFRRPCYREIMDTNVQYDPENEVFPTWTKEEGQYYHLIKVEVNSEKRIPDQVQIFNSSRNIFVYFYKKTADVHWCYANKPNEMFLIAGNRNGYWDTPYHYHHRNGYLIDKGKNLWEEYHSDKRFAKFTRVENNMN